MITMLWKISVKQQILKSRDSSLGIFDEVSVSKLQPDLGGYGLDYIAVHYRSDLLQTFISGWSRVKSSLKYIYPCCYTTHVTWNLVKLRHSNICWRSQDGPALHYFPTPAKIFVICNNGRMTPIYNVGHPFIIHYTIIQGWVRHTRDTTAILLHFYFFVIKYIIFKILRIAWSCLWQNNELPVCTEKVRDGRMRRETLKLRISKYIHSDNCIVKVSKGDSLPSASLRYNKCA